MNVLVIDDDQVVCSVVRHILERDDHTVLLASNGADGLAAFGEHHETVEMAIIDVCLPDMGGIEVLRQLRLIKPGLPCLICSGIGGGIDDIPKGLRDRVEFLRKPFLSDELLSTILGFMVTEPE